MNNSGGPTMGAQAFMTGQMSGHMAGSGVSQAVSQFAGAGHGYSQAMMMAVSSVLQQIGQLRRSNAASDGDQQSMHTKQGMTAPDSVVQPEDAANQSRDGKFPNDIDGWR